MSLLPKNRQKRTQLYLALAGAVLLIGGIAFGLIHPQFSKLSDVRIQTKAARDRLETYQRLIQQSDTISNQLAGMTVQLAQAETDLATGDVYAWTIDTIHHFKAGYKVDVPEIGQPSVGPMDMFPNFPYRQIRFNLRGAGYYHDIGKFIADFENTYPHMRVVNLDIVPLGTDTEKLSFNMDIVALVKTSS